MVSEEEFSFLRHSPFLISIMQVKNHLIAMQQYWEKGMWEG